MRALKAAIVIMGLLIVAGVAVLVAELVKRANDPERRAAAEERVTVTGGPVLTGLDLPPGARMAEMVAVGSRLALRVMVPDGEDRLFIVDPRSGAVTAAVTTGKAASLPGAAP